MNRRYLRGQRFGKSVAWIRELRNDATEEDRHNARMVQPNPGFAGELNYLAKETGDFLIAHSFAL